MGGNFFQRNFYSFLLYKLYEISIINDTTPRIYENIVSQK
jgi:hypothetical protein